MRYGVVVFDNNGGDYSVHVVDEERWNQIKALPFSGQAYCEAVGWLTSDAREETDPPRDAPVRVGSCFKEFLPTLRGRNDGRVGNLARNAFPLTNHRS
jgi:hypothetical protein